MNMLSHVLIRFKYYKCYVNFKENCLLLRLLKTWSCLWFVNEFSIILSICFVFVDSVGWLPRDKYLITDLSECTSVLVYVVDLVRPGSVTFTYQYTDETLLFMFEVFKNLKKRSKLNLLLSHLVYFEEMQLRRLALRQPRVMKLQAALFALPRHLTVYG